jgi:putative tricarboxylic transport membrane protein
MKGEATVLPEEPLMTANRWPNDALSGVALIALSLWLWFYTASFPELDEGYPGPALFPRIIALGLGCAGLILLVQALRSRAKTSPGKRTLHYAGIARFAAGIGLVFAYPFFIEQIHFIPVMAVLIFVYGLLLRSPHWHALAISILGAALIYALFTSLLGVPL